MYRFGSATVDPSAREVRVDGEAVRLEPQAFDLLVHLIEHRHEVVAKPDLLDAVWGHRFVSEAALTTRIKEIRRAVGDDGSRQTVVRNVRGRGYRFVAELQPDDQPAIRDDGQLATPAHRLIGRAHELDQVLGRLATHRLVTLVGPGGVGKSALARAAMQHASRLGEAVHLVELAPLGTGDAVLPAMAAALDTVVDPDRPDRAIATIAGRHCLILLDNCEHVVDYVAHVVDSVLAATGVVARVLATSQVRLGVADEQVINLAPLDPAEAAALFRSRANAIRRDWCAATVDTDRVRRLVEQLDRLPLMIEMVAARLGSMTFVELELAVGEGTQLIQMTHRTPTPRHRTAASLVEWSAGLLSPDDRRAFVEFSVFAGAVTADDAGAVLGPSAPIALGELADRSLLAVDLSGPAARYRMLDTVRAVARGWLDRSEQAALTYRRHAAAITDVAEAIDAALRSPAELTGRARLQGLVPEIRAAYRSVANSDPELLDRLSAALHLAAYGRLWSEPATWASAALARVVEGNHSLDALLLVAGGAANAADLDLARRLAESVLDATANARSKGTALEILSDVSMYTGRLDDCRRQTAELDAIGRSLADPHMIAIAAVNDALATTFGGAPEQALERLAGVWIDALPPSGAAWLAYANAEALSGLRSHDRAIAAYEHAIGLSRAVNNPFVMSVAQSSLAAEHARCRQHEPAYRAYADCLHGYLHHGNLVHAVVTLRNLVTLLHADRRSSEAAVLGTVATAEGLRPTHGDETEQLGTILAEIEASVTPDEYAGWQAEGRRLDLVTATRVAIGAVERRQ